MQTILFEEIGDILVFLTGQEEIEETQHLLSEKLSAIDESLLSNDTNV
jgi:HrpA-like RNA helicase